MTRAASSDNGFKNERVFTNWVLGQARKRGWVCAHLETMRVVRKPNGGMFAVPNKDADGFPDVVLVHQDYGLVFCELKMPGRKPDEAQLRWLLALRAADVRVYIWWPRDADEILDVLDGHGPAQTSLIAEQIVRAP